MRLEVDAIGLTAIILVSLAYVLFGCVFLFRRKPRQNRSSQARSRSKFRDRAAKRVLRVTVDFTSAAMVAFPSFACRGSGARVCSRYFGLCKLLV